MRHSSSPRSSSNDRALVLAHHDLAFPAIGARLFGHLQDCVVDATAALWWAWWQSCEPIVGKYGDGVLAPRWRREQFPGSLLQRFTHNAPQCSWFFRVSFNQFPANPTSFVPIQPALCLSNKVLRIQQGPANPTRVHCANGFTMRRGARPCRCAHRKSNAKSISSAGISGCSPGLACNRLSVAASASNSAR